jgi:hypothetical protein
MPEMRFMFLDAFGLDGFTERLNQLPNRTLVAAGIADDESLQAIVYATGEGIEALAREHGGRKMAGKH